MPSIIDASHYSDLHKDIFGFRPRHEITPERVAALWAFYKQNEEALAAQWAAEAAASRAYYDELEREEATAYARWKADQAEATEVTRQCDWDDLAARAANHRRYAIPARHFARGL